MKKTILVSGASGIVGYGILKSLRDFRDEYITIGTTIHKDSVAPAFCDHFEFAEPTSSSKYLDWLCSIIKKYNVDLIIPSIEADMYLWNENRAVIEELGCKLLLNNCSLIDLCQDKWLFYSELSKDVSEYLIPTKEFSIDADFDYPIIVKPKRGFGSKGIHRITSSEELNKHHSSLSKDFIVQPLIGSDEEEYTVSGFFDKNHELIDYIAFKRKLSTEGFTDVAEVTDYDFSLILEDISAVVKPIGPTNFQFRLHNGGMKLLEINPRVSSSTSIRSALGFNECKYAVDYFLKGIRPKSFDKEKIIGKKAVRYTEDIIL